MKNIVLLIVVACSSCYSQNGFDAFAKKFKKLEIPLVDFPKISSDAILDGKGTNDFIINKQEQKPKYVDKDGELKVVTQYYGLYPEAPFKYGHKGRQLEYYSKIQPIGRIRLQPKFTSLIIKVTAFDATFFDLWNFSEDGQVLSVICLFWGLRDAGPLNEEVTFNLVQSRIEKDGRIIWSEKNDGLETIRIYKLDDSGYFRILKEERKGEYKY